MDMRTPLPSGCCLQLYTQRECTGQTVSYTIDSLIGSGANCLVYMASYEDTLHEQHTVLIKECYPYVLTMNRTGLNLRATARDISAFSRALSRFEHSYVIGVRLRQESGLTNSTAESWQLLYANGTSYMVISYNEGASYNVLPNESLHDTLCRIQALSAIISRYHKHGYVHLDLKPANILILPESKDHLLLLDFDTIYSLQALQAGHYPLLCYSADYAAPEQRLNQPEKIGPPADIYAIGAITYEKIMGLSSSHFEFDPRRKYDVSQLKQRHPDLPPEFWKDLISFFKRTLAPSISNRYTSLDGPFKEQLQQLIDYSRPEQHVLQEHFTYHNDCFIGRHEELTTMHAALHHGNVLFLHGLGGIGKSELARQYAWKFRQEYDTIVWIPYMNSLVETTASDEYLSISHLSQDAQENDDSYYRRKWHILKQCCTDRCLFILDNLDCEDEQLEEWLSCPAKIIVTSRLDMSDWNYPQLDIAPFATLEEQKQLFDSYNNHSYDSSEEKAILELLHYIDGHTMTIELLAKELRDTLLSPQEMLRRFHTAAGITTADDISVRHRKDFHLNKKPVLQHLYTLFSLADLAVSDHEAMQNLALLGGIHMEEKTFCQWCAIPAATIAHLLQRGWLKRDDSGKLYLHQIILDLTYQYAPPTAATCRPLLTSLRTVLQKGFCTTYERRLYNSVCSTVLQRTYGESPLLLRLCWLYCAKIINKKDLLLRCIRGYGQITPTPLLALGQCETLLALYYQQVFCDNESDNPWEQAVCLYEQALNHYQQLHPVNVIAQTRAMLQLGSNCLHGIPIEAQVDEGTYAVRFAEIAETTWLTALEMLKPHLANDEQARKLAEQLLDSLINFYDSDNFSLGLLSDKLGDEIKKLQYTEMLEALQQPSQAGSFDLSFTYSDTAYYFLYRKEYDTALAYYEQALSHDECREFFLPHMAEACEKTGRLEEALHCYEQLLAIDQGHGSLVPLSADYRELARLHSLLGQDTLCRSRLSQCLQAARNEVDDTEPYRLLALGLALQLAHSLYPEESAYAADLQSLCQSHFSELITERDALRLLLPYLDTLAKKEQFPQYTQACQRLVSQWLTHFMPATDSDFKALSDFLDASLTQYKNKSRQMELDMTYYMGRLLHEQWKYVPEQLQQLERALPYYETAYKLACRNTGAESWQAMDVLQNLAELHDDMGNLEKADSCRRHCDYALLARTRIEKDDGTSPADIWEDAARHYLRCDDYAGALQCYDALLSSWQPHVSDEEQCRTYTHILLQAACQGVSLKNTALTLPYLQQDMVFLDALLTQTQPSWCHTQILSQWYSDCADEAIQAGQTDIASKAYMTSLWLVAYDKPQLPDSADAIAFRAQSPHDALSTLCQSLEQDRGTADGDAILELTAGLARVAKTTDDPELTALCQRIKALYEQTIFALPN